MKSYTFRVILEQDSFPDGTLGYFACVPALEHLGVATQGRTGEEAVANLREILEKVLEELAEEGNLVLA